MCQVVKEDEVLKNMDEKSVPYLQQIFQTPLCAYVPSLLSSRTYAAIEQRFVCSM